jgi:plasmid stability protein
LQIHANGDIAVSIMEAFLAQLVVRNLDDDVKAKLQRRAHRHGRSTEEEVHEILRSAVRHEVAPSRPLGTQVKSRFARLGLEEDIPELPGQQADPADFTS